MQFVADPANSQAVARGDDPSTGQTGEALPSGKPVIGHAITTTDYLIEPLAANLGSGTRLALARVNGVVADQTWDEGSPAGRQSPVPHPHKTYRMLRLCAEKGAALLCLILLAPFMVTMLVVIRATSEGTGLFWSQRVGRHGHLFSMPKFRTMYSGTDLVPREKMVCLASPVTPIGGWLRRWSLDELPQLWSILIGDMSFIGPRPLIPTDEAQLQRRRLGLAPHVRPGLTGLAQINGRNHVSPRAKARYDVFYGNRVSAKMDLMILRRTVYLVIRGTGIW